MSKPFFSIRTKLGLDDILTFGKYRGNTVQEIISEENDPGYIAWLQDQGYKFYQSVHEVLEINKPRKNTYFKMNNTHLLDDPVYLEGFDDVPF